MLGPITQSAVRSTKQYNLARTTGAGSKKEAKIELKMQKKSQFCAGFWCFFVVNLKKQSQFANGQNERKYLQERGI